MNEQVTKQLDKLLGLNTTAIFALGALCGGLLYVGVVVGDYANRLERVEQRASVAEGCASQQQCQVVRDTIEGIQHRVIRLEVKAGLVP